MRPINEYLNELIEDKRYSICKETSIVKSDKFIQTTDFKIHDIPVKFIPYIKGDKNHEKYKDDILNAIEETGNVIINNWSKIAERVISDYHDYIMSSEEETWIKEYKKYRNNITDHIKLNRVTAIIVSKSPVRLTYELRISCLNDIIDSELVMTIKITGKNSIHIYNTEWD